MLKKEYWDFHPEWLEYIKQNWSGQGMVEQVKNHSPESLAFQAKCKQALTDMGIRFKGVNVYMNTQIPEDGEGYAKGYPHIHYPQTGMSIIHYLQPGDKPAPLDVWEDSEILETIYPEPGLTVFMPNKVWHGARKNKGTTNRIQFIAKSY